MTHDPRAELADLTRQVRAWVEWLADSGVGELGAEGDVKSTLAALAKKRAPKGRGASSGSRGVRPAPAPFAAPAAPVPAPAPAPPAVGPSLPGVAAAEAEELPLDERKKRLELLREEIAGCTKCPLHKGRTQTVFARGNPDAELMFVGEGPGLTEDQQGLPFVGKAGQLLDKMITAMGLSPDEVHITNIVRCRPPDNRKPDIDEMAACAPYLRRQIELVRPSMLVALGATGVQGLLGTSMGITRLRGNWKLYKGRIPLMPTFHPAYLLRQPEKKREVWDDLKQVMLRMGKAPPEPQRGG